MDATLDANTAPGAAGDLVRFGGNLLKGALTRKPCWSSRPSLVVTAWLFLLSLHHAALAIARARRLVRRATERDRPQLLAFLTDRAQPTFATYWARAVAIRLSLAFAMATSPMRRRMRRRRWSRPTPASTS